MRASDYQGLYAQFSGLTSAVRRRAFARSPAGYRTCGLPRDPPDAMTHDEPMTDISAHEYAMDLPIAAVVAELAARVGLTTVAAIGGVRETRAVQQWIDALREPQRPHVLRFGLQLVMMVAGADGHETANAWLHGGNPRLDDASPLALLRDESLETVQMRLLAAARAFANRGPAA